MKFDQYIIIIIIILIPLHNVKVAVNYSVNK